MRPGAVLGGARAALVFLTRIPAGPKEITDTDQRWAPAWFPAIGSLVGVAAALAFVLLSPLSHGVAALGALLTSVVLTGGLHEDGLADTADALGGGRDRVQVLAILKDSRIGVFGATALFFSLSLRAATAAALGDLAPLALVMAHTCARLTPTVLMRALPYVTERGLAKSAAFGRPGRAQLVGASAWATVTLASAGWAGSFRWSAALAVALVAMGVGTLCAMRFRARVGGVTGDFLGAAEQLTEVGVMLALLSTI